MIRRAALAAALAAGLLGARPGAASAASCTGANTHSVVPSANAITIAINSFVPTGVLVADYCFQLAAGTYNESVFIGNRTAGPNFRVVISSAAGAGGNVIIAPTVGKPAFDIEMDSVTLQGLIIRPGATAQNWGVSATTVPAVVLSSVTIDETGFAWGSGGAQLSQFAEVRFSSITTSSALALSLQGNGSVVQFSTITSRVIGAAAGALTSGAGSTGGHTVLSSYVSNLGVVSLSSQNGMVITAGAGTAVIASTVSTMAPDSNSSAIYVNGVTGTNISTSAIFGSGGYGLYLQANGNFVYGSTLTTAGSEALYIRGGIGNVVDGSVLSNSASNAVQLDLSASNNVIQRSTITTTSAANNAVWMQNSAAGNSVNQCYMRSAGGAALQLSNLANSNTINNSTMTASGAPGVLINSGASTTTVTRGVVSGNIAFKVTGAGSNYNTLSLSTATTNTTVTDVVLFQGGVGNAVVGSLVTNPFGGGSGVHLQPGNNSVISFSTGIVGGGGAAGILFDGTLGSTITASVFSSLFGDPVVFQNGAIANTLNLSAFANTSGGICALFVGGASNNYNTINQSYFGPCVGNGLEIDSGQFNAISGSTITSAIGPGAGNGALVFTLGSTANNFVTGSVIQNLGTGDAAQFSASAGFNKITFSTLTALGGGANAVDFVGSAAGNQLINSYAANSGGSAAQFQTAATQNTIAQSTLVGTGGGSTAVLFNATSTNTVVNSSMIDLAGIPAYLFNASSNTIAFSSMTAANGAGPALSLIGAATNTITGSYISNPPGLAVSITNPSFNDTISFSTMTNAGVSFALDINGASNNQILGDFVFNSGGNAIVLENGANFNTIANSTASTFGSGAAVFLGGGAGANGNTISGDFFYGGSVGSGLLLNAAVGNQIANSTITSHALGGNGAAFFGVGTASNNVAGVYFEALGGSLGVAISSGAHNNAITQSQIVANTLVNPAFQDSIGMGLAPYMNTVSLSSITNLGGDAALLFQDANDSILTSTVTSPRFAVTLNKSLNALLNGDVVIGSTAVFVNGSTNTTVAGSGLYGGIGVPGDGLAILGGGFGVTIGSLTINNVGFPNYGLLDNAVGPVAVTGFLNIRGQVAVLGVAVADGGAYTHTFGRDLVVTGGGSSLSAPSSTLIFDGFNNLPTPQAIQTFTYPSAATVGGLKVNTANVTFTAAGAFPLTSGFLIDTVSPSTLTFLSNGTFNINNFLIGGAAPGAIALVASAPPSPWILNVFTSSVTGAAVGYSNAGGGQLVQANDGTVVNLTPPNNVNWGFQPQLVVQLPGQVYANGTGLVGAPSAQVAGVPFNAVVRAVSYSSTTVNAAAMSVTLAGTDPFQNPPNGFPALTQPLVNGVTTFSNLTVQAAEGPASVSSYTARGAPAITAYQNQLTAGPAWWTGLQVVVPSEQTNPGSLANGGKLNLPDVQIAGRSVPAVFVRAVDNFNNSVSSIAATVKITGTTSATATWQSAGQAMAGGATVFASTLTFYSTGTFLFSVATVGGGPGAVSAPITVSQVSLTSPTVHLNVDQSTVTTLGGGLTGFAFDAGAVNKVLVAISTIGAGPSRGYFNFANPGSFNSATAILATATLQGQGAFVNWGAPVSDGVLADKTSYYVEMRAVDASNNVTVVYASFTFQPSLLGFGGNDGKGSAAIVPPAATGCEPVISTVVFTVGAGGIQPGGGVAVQVPQNWTAPIALDVNNPPGLGLAYLASTNGAALSGASIGIGGSPIVGQPGGGWMTVSVAPAGTPFNPGDAILFTVSAIPPLGPGGRGPQSFSIVTRGAGTVGSFQPIVAQPAILLTPGTTSFIAFTDPAPISLGPLQTSATMQLKMTDLCGNLVSTDSVVMATITVMGSNQSGLAVDANAVIYSSAGVAQNSVTFPAFSSFSSGFYYQTSTSGVTYELVRATATALGRYAASYTEANRSVNLLVSSLSLTNVSVDTGTVIPGQTQAIISSPNPAIIRFGATVSGAPWSVVISTDNGAFYPPRFIAYGLTDSSHPVSLAWAGVDTLTNQAPQFLSGGTFYVLIRGANGAVRDTSLRIVIPPSPYLAGNLGAAGAGAQVAVIGPGTGFANNGIATSTGYFQVFGLVNGQFYAVQASTAISVGGQVVTLSTGAVGVQAAVGPVLQTLSFPATSFLRVSVTLPQPAARDFTGAVKVFSSSGAAVAVASLHYPAGLTTSDNGAQAFGQAASTWTLLLVTPDTYTIQVDLPDVRLSTQLVNVLVNPYRTVDEALSLAKKANVYGFVVLPTTTSFGTQVSIQAGLVGLSTPSIFGGTFVPPFSAVSAMSSSGPYVLYGLDPGSWTITAKAPGFISNSALISISSNADVGDPTYLTSGVQLSLSSGGAINGTITVPGDSTMVNQCIAPNCFGVFDLAVQAYNLATFANAATVVRFVKDPALTKSTFTIGGLASGSYLVSTSLNGFVLGPAGGQLVTVSTPAVATSSLTLTATNAAVQLNIQLPPLPGGACHPLADFKKVGFSGPGPFFGSFGYPDITKLPFSTKQVFCSSMTVVTPPQLTGYAKYQLVYAPTGAQAIKTVPLTGNSTTVINVDLGVATFTVSGKASFSGSVQLPVVVGQSTYTVSVSTLGGILQFAPTNYFCLITSTDAQPANALHMELIPLDPNNPTSAPGFKQAGTIFGLPPFPPPPPNNCGVINPESPAGDLAIMGYLAAIQPDGSFTFPGVAAGDYLLRNAPDLDLNPADGNEIGYSQQFVRVTANTTGVRVDLNQGFTVSGLIVLPPGMTTSRMIMLFLKDSLGNAIASVPVGFNAAHAASFVLPNVANGVYSLVARDFGFPTIFVAKPLAISVAGQPLANQNVQMQLGGNITASLAIQQVLADGSKQFVVITPQNKNLLPAGLTVDAIAQPWFDGGFFHASSPNCGVWGCTGQDSSGLNLDANGKLQIQDVLPGAYNVEFTFPNGAGSGATGGLALVSTVKSGVSVAPGQTVDLGVVGIVAGTNLSGQVTDVATSSPIANASMVARPSLKLPGQTNGRAGFLTVQTDQSGRYTLSGLDPAVRFYDVYAADRGQQAQGVSAAPYEQQIAPSVDIQSTSTLNFALAFASFSVSGQVVGFPGDQLLTGQGQGQGASRGATIFLQKAGVVPTKNPVADVVFQTDANGNFAIPNLTAGFYRLYATALGYGTYSGAVTISNASPNLGVIQLAQGAGMFGSIRKADGSLPSEDEAHLLVGATSDLSDFFFGMLTRDPITRGITGYRLAGFKAGLHYRLIFVSADDELSTPSEASDLVFLSTAELRNVDVTFRPSKPYVTAKSTRVGNNFKVTLRVSQPCRERLLGDDNLSVMLTTSSARGFISSVTLSIDRRELSASYTPGVNESSFTLKLSAYTAIKDPNSLDPINPEFVVLSTPTFFIGTDGASALNINNVQGGGIVMDGDQARITLPKGAFSVDASSGVQVVFQKSVDGLAGAKLAAQGTPTVEANIRALRYAPSAYPSSLFQAMASLPPSVSPFSGFYDVLLPLGIRTALAKPVQMTVSYSTSTTIDPSQLNLYWFNAAANAYVLQQDVTGAPPIIDRVNHTITINVNHFSTFVLFNTGVNVITGATFGGTDITAYNFPNPFDLSTKQVSTIHGGGTPAVRGTMISIGLPLDVSGGASLKIFNVAGERVRSIDLGSVTGGSYYYQPWDGRNDSGLDVASGVYIGQVKVGGKSKFFKMALIK